MSIREKMYEDVGQCMAFLNEQNRREFVRFLYENYAATAVEMANDIIKLNDRARAKGVDVRKLKDKKTVDINIE